MSLPHIPRKSNADYAEFVAQRAVQKMVDAIIDNDWPAAPFVPGPTRKYISHALADGWYTATKSAFIADGVVYENTPKTTWRPVMKGARILIERGYVREYKTLHMDVHYKSSDLAVVMVGKESSTTSHGVSADAQRRTYDRDVLISDPVVADAWLERTT